jgi:uncharacterized membrane protein
MDHRDPTSIEATAKLGGHPIHPMIVPFPITLLFVTFVCDLIFWWTGDGFWPTAAFWALGGAIVTAIAAAIAGFTDFAGNERIRAMSSAWMHMAGNAVALVLAIANFWIRYDGDAAAAVLPWGLALSTIIVLILVYTAWLGGELVYRYRVGIQPAVEASAARYEPARGRPAE